MGWQGTRMLTNGEHDDLWRSAFTSIPEINKLSNISDSLRRTNLLFALKELHELGKIDDEAYAKDLLSVAKMEGYIIE